MEGPVPDIRHLGEAIWELREEIGITSEKLAREAGVDPAHLNRAENHGKDLTWKKLTSLVKVLDIPVSKVVLRAEEIARSGRPPKARKDDQ